MHDITSVTSLLWQRLWRQQDRMRSAKSMRGKNRMGNNNIAISCYCITTIIHCQLWRSQLVAHTYIARKRTLSPVKVLNLKSLPLLNQELHMVILWKLSNTCYLRPPMWLRPFQSQPMSRSNLSYVLHSLIQSNMFKYTVKISRWFTTLLGYILSALRFMNVNKPLASSLTILSLVKSTQAIKV